MYYETTLLCHHCSTYCSLYYVRCNMATIGTLGSFWQRVFDLFAAAYMLNKVGNSCALFVRDA